MLNSENAYSKYKVTTQKKILYIFALISLLACVIYSVSFVIIEAKVAAFFQLATAFGFLIVLGKAKKGNYKHLKEVSVIMSVLIVLHQSTFMFGRSYGFHFQLLALLVVIHLLFDFNLKKERINIFVFSLINLLAFFYIELSNIASKYQLPVYENLYRCISITMTFVGISVILVFFSRNNMLDKQKLYNLATIDELTGVFNRRSFIKRGKEVFRIAQLGGETFTVLMFDIDYFKSINDEYGHLVGDHVLKQMSHATKEVLREEDYIYRYGGEEFGIIFENKTSLQAEIIAEKIRNHLEGCVIEVDNIKIQRTISIGLSEFDYSIDTFEDLIDKADKAMYRSKEDGKNKITIYK